MHLPGQLSTLQFGVNEISSALTIIKTVGSFLSVDRDSAIFLALEQQYSVFFQRLPEHLKDVKLNRGGTVLGSGQRRIPSKSMLPKIKLDSVTGIATFVILILRYVETPADIVDYLQSLLKGELGAIRGGKLEPIGSEQAKETLPYSIRDNLRTYVGGILDADAESEQHEKCMQWFIQLSDLASRAHNVSSLSKYSHSDHRRFLKRLLGCSHSSEDSPSTQFHTLSTGTAMIALAAMANGANVSLHCVLSERERIILPKNHSRNTTASPVSVILWLTEPPEDVAKAFRVVGTSQKGSRGGSKPRMIPIYGGDAEISCVIAQQLSCRCPADIRLRLWEEGVKLGKEASWEVANPNSHRVVLRLCETFTSTRIPAHLDPVARTWYSGPQSDKRHKLARKAAIVYHKVNDHSDYTGIAGEAKEELDLILTAFAIGCLKSLISNTTRSLSTYALALEEPDGPGSGPTALLDFCKKLLAGHSLDDLLLTVGTVWGGLTPQLGFPDGKLVGIVCPEVTILLDVLSDPKLIAQHGLEKGIMSLHTGSVPILPRDPLYGAIMAGDPNPEQIYKTVDASKEQISGSAVSEVIFTVEPFAQTNGSLSAIICGWESGDVAFELDPFNVFKNLIHKRTLELADAEVGTENTLIRRELQVQQDQTQVHIRKNELLDLQFFKLNRVIGIIDIGPRFDWQVVAAGCALPGNAIMVVKKEECDSLRAKMFDLNRIASDICLILCQDQEVGTGGGRIEEIEAGDQ